MTTGDVTAQPRLDVEYDWEFNVKVSAGVRA